MRRSLAILAALLAGGAGTARAGAPDLDPGVRLRDGGSDLAVDAGYSSPEAADWDHDGRPDLICGQRTSGALRLYRNRSAAGPPAFDGSVLLEAAGAAITTGGG